MRRAVVDASVVAAAFFAEEHTKAASRLLTTSAELLAPDLIHAELAGVIWKRHRRGEIAEDEAPALLADMMSLPLRVTPCGELAEGALQIAVRTGVTVYDALYLALAASVKLPMVTADRRLLRALAGGPLAKCAVWIGE